MSYNSFNESEHTHNGETKVFMNMFATTSQLIGAIMIIIIPTVCAILFGIKTSEPVDPSLTLMDYLNVFKRIILKYKVITSCIGILLFVNILVSITTKDSLPDHQLAAHMILTYIVLKIMFWIGAIYGVLYIIGLIIGGISNCITRTPEDHYHYHYHIPACNTAVSNVCANCTMMNDTTEEYVTDHCYMYRDAPQDGKCDLGPINSSTLAFNC